MTKNETQFNKGDLVQLRAQDAKLKKFAYIKEDIGIILDIDYSRREKDFIYHVYFSQLDSTKKIYGTRLKKKSS